MMLNKQYLRIGIGGSIWVWLCACGAPAPPPPTPTVSVAAPLPTPSSVRLQKLGRIDYDTVSWTEALRADSTLLLDLKYATTDNFTRQPLYECPRCFVRPPVAQALRQANSALRQKGYRLLLKDCYRPQAVQKKLWAALPDDTFVTPPWKGSMHTRGLAIDVTLATATGDEVDMGTPYDFFGKAAYANYQQLPDSILQHRRLLRETLSKYGFKGIRTEWWHFSFVGSKYTTADMLWQCHEGGF